MKFQTLFPLVVATSELEGSDRYKQAFVQRILELREASEHYVNSDSSWTGDVHGIDTLHFDPVFTWLSEQVVVRAVQYLDRLGYDLDKYDLYLQRSWPVIGKKGQAVTPHTHPNAHLSAVYYVSVPKASNGGKLVFINQARPNELFEGVTSPMTQGYRKFNAFNTPTATFKPVEGHLVIFPSNTSHAVEPNPTDEMRVSISYDLVLTARLENNPGRTPEFILPSPAKWRKAEFQLDKTPSKPAQTKQVLRPHVPNKPIANKPVSPPEPVPQILPENQGGTLNEVPEMKPLPDPMSPSS